MEPYTYVCRECGSKNVTSDAIAKWSEKTQSWEISCLLDNEDCGDCGANGDHVTKKVTL